MRIAIFIFLCLSSSSTLAVIIKGKIGLEEHESSDICFVKVNKRNTACDSRGWFSIEVKKTNVYAVTVTAKNHYRIFQSFSDYELDELSDKHKTSSNNTYYLPSITLVKKLKGRTMFAFAGDVMMGRRYSKPYFSDPVLIGEQNKLKDTKAIVQHMKPYLELADFSAINLETQISKDQPVKRAPKGVIFYSPPETLDALKWAGTDYLTLGNNHIYDYLDEGLLSTLDFLKKSGLGFSGAGINQNQALKPYIKSLAGHRYAMLGYVGWTGSARPNQVAEENKGGSAFGAEENIAKAVLIQQQQGRPTIVQYHGSLEYSDEPSGMTESRLKMAIDKGADLVIAHHPHVTQGFEIYREKLIAYSMGNFIFDQNFHATPLSYVLYVWMDGEKFHRAEIVPIYIKGYVPVPATGIQRSNVIKRTKYLSARRKLTFTTSGGHLVLKEKQSPQESTISIITMSPNSRIADLYGFPEKQIFKVKTDHSETRYRLGINQLNGGDFESFNLFSSQERGWELINAKISSNHSHSGANSLAINIKQHETSLVGMKTFRRVFNAGSSMSYAAQILNKNGPINVRLLLQKRKKRAKFFEALSSKKMILGEKVITPNQYWQSIEFDFNLPRVGYRSYRVLLELSFATDSNKKEIIYLDDVALIDWQAHYNNWNVLPLDSEQLFLATHIGMENESKNTRKITIGTLLLGE